MPDALPPAPVLSVVVPALNEDAVLERTYAALRAEMEKLGEPFEIVFVDDGSTDRTRAIMAALSASDPRVRAVLLSRNFGHEIATSAGLHFARGQAAVVIDADLQDPPDLIPEFVARWREGYHVVYGVRLKREGEGLPKRLTAFLFYRLMRFVSDVDIPPDTGDFRLIDRAVLNVFRDLKEDPRFFRGLIPWIGFKQIGVPFVRRPRAGGASKYRPIRLLRLALDTITSFSTYTAMLATLLALALAAVSFAGIAGVVGLWAVGSLDVPGWGFAALGFLGLWNVQFLVLAMLGEYLVRTHGLAQSRPLYVVESVVSGGKPGPPNAAAEGDR